MVPIIGTYSALYRWFSFICCSVHRGCRGDRQGRGRLLGRVNLVLDYLGLLLIKKHECIDIYSKQHIFSIAVFILGVGETGERRLDRWAESSWNLGGVLLVLAYLSLLFLEKYMYMYMKSYFSSLSVLYSHPILCCNLNILIFIKFYYIVSLK